MGNCRERAALVFLFALWLVLAIVRAQLQECELLTAEDLGSADAPSPEGIIAESYIRGDSPEAPLVQILQSRTVCLVAGRTPDRYRWTSVIVRYMCDGAVSRFAQAPCGNNVEVTAQFDLGCGDAIQIGDPPIWIAGISAVPTYVTSPPDGDFSTPLRISCSLCVNPEEGGDLLNGTGIEIDVESHCAGTIFTYMYPMPIGRGNGLSYIDNGKLNNVD